MYRLRTPDTHKPLFVANQVIQDYSENRVDTLHMKNLLHLGEDRYLTTLLLKHFPNYKTQFVRDAHAYTVAPEEWKVLLSQRRRWINSTVHNLAELVFLDRLCGFCCFSMRFIVFIDLLSTIIQPVTVAYVRSCRVSCKELEADCSYSDCLLNLPDRGRTPAAAFVLDCYVGSHLRSAGTGLRIPPEMGYDRLDAVLDRRYSCVFVLRPSLRLLAHGRLLLGSDTYRHG
jgi:hypothetical protein